MNITVICVQRHWATSLE